MDVTDIYAYLAYSLYLVWMVQGARLLVMVVNRSWDEAPSLRAVIAACIARRKRRKP